MLFASGIPFDVEESIDSQNTDGIWERPLLVPEQKLTVPNRSKNEWFKTNAFAPSTYVYGNSAQSVEPGRDQGLEPYGDQKFQDALC